MEINKNGYRRQTNTAMVLKAIKERGPINRSLIAKSLDCTLATVSTIVSDLLAENLVIEKGKDNNSAGRKATFLEYNWKKGYVIGINVDETNHSAAISDLSGLIIERVNVKNNSGNSASYLISALSDLVDNLLHSSKLDRSEIKMIAVGVPGRIKQPEGEIIAAPTLDLFNYPLARILREELGLPVIVENGVNLAAIAEKHIGAGINSDSLVYFNIRKGIKAGIVLNGQLFRGYNGEAGEIGFMALDREYIEGDYSSFGYFETKCGFSAIKRKVAEGMEKGLVTSLQQNLNEFKLSAFFEALHNEDPLANAVFNDIIDYIAMAIANIACNIAPDVIILSYDLSLAGDVLIKAIQQRINKLIPEVPRILRSKLGKEAMLLGAITIALDAYNDGTISSLPQRLVK